MNDEENIQDFLTIHIKYENTISLLDFKNSLEGWYNQYNKHLSRSNISNKDETLLIKEIKQGSIILQLISSAVLLFSDINNITTFFTSIKFAIDWLSNKKGIKPKYDIDELKNLEDIIAPVNNTNNSIHISVNGDKNTVLVIDHVEAKVIKSAIEEEKATLAIVDKVEPVPDLSEHENVMLKLTQIEGAEKNNKNTKGKITDIDDKSYPISFEEGLKQIIIHDSENPLLKNYLVDAKIHRVGDKINSYTILKVIDSFYDESGEQSEQELFK